MARILVIDDETEVTTFFKYFLEKLSHEVIVAHEASAIDFALSEHVFDLAIVDLKLPDIDGLTILKKIKNFSPSTEVIIMTGYSTVKTAIDAIQLGACDYIEKPFEDIQKLRIIIEQSLTTQTASNCKFDQLAEETGFIIGNNAEMRKLFDITKKIAAKNISILIHGETGTGKEVLARFIHNASQRRKHPFIGVNCGALPDSLLESELFGHEKGAFTGASQMRKGFFEIASRGTLFLDEVGEAHLQTQVKLLRVLETHEFMRIGGEEAIKTNTRIVSATNVDLERAVTEKKFRSDLLYRLEGVKLVVPPLRERLEDIPDYIDLFIRKILKTESAPKRFSAKSIEVLQNYNWPGNIRELYNTVEHTLALLDESTHEIDLKHLPEKILQSISSNQVHISNQPGNSFKADPIPLENTVPLHKNRLQDMDGYSLAEWIEIQAEKIIDYVEVRDGFNLQELLNEIRQAETRIAQEVIKKALRQTMGNRKKAGELLNLNSRSIRYLLNEKGKIANGHE